MRGRFVTFEGPEGSGKTTHARRLIERLEGRGLAALYAREPGGTPTGELIREILQHDRCGEPLCPPAEALLFAASRAQLVDRIIRPALEAGRWVVCDRFADSTTVYQGYGRGFGADRMIALNDFATAGVMPDLTFLLDVDVAAGFERLADRHREQGGGPDRLERENRAFHERVRAGYLDLARRFPERFRVVDASGSVGEVDERVWAEVRDALL
jgi:dTMP kinase